MIWKCEGQENLDYSRFLKLFIIIVVIIAVNTYRPFPLCVAFC